MTQLQASVAQKVHIDNLDARLHDRQVETARQRVPHDAITALAIHVIPKLLFELNLPLVKAAVILRFDGRCETS